MPITRTIYTQGKVTLKTGAIGGTLSNFAVVSGVQNATFSLDTPRENVSSFGYKGLVDKVQVAPETATVSFSYILPKNDIEVDVYAANANHLSPSKISGLMGDALSDTHSGVHVELAGLGCLISGIMSSFSINASAGDLATVDMTFEGVPSGGSIGQDTDAELPAKNSSISTATYEVLTPDRISGYLPDNSLGSDGGESIISFRVFQNTGATIYVNSGLDAAGGETDLTAGTAVALADGVETTVSFARTFATNDVLTLKFSANADGTGNVTSSGSTAIYIKNVTVSTDGGPNNAGNFAGCVQTATFSWEVPIERIQCLGETVSSSTNYSNPPGTSSLTLEGIDIPYPVSGLTLGDMRIMLRNAKVVSREHNLAVGDVAATFNLSLEATAMDALMFPTLTSN